ncbi:hypothetical protein GGR52DRAFT_109476 [Hypoxylon sp. FL1284]|nr:hypothetical protein GGR52DRAFT_109476 [Hypoxylon sp. FL1284]
MSSHSVAVRLHHSPLRDQRDSEGSDDPIYIHSSGLPIALIILGVLLDNYRRVIERRAYLEALGDAVNWLKCRTSRSSFGYNAPSTSHKLRTYSWCCIWARTCLNTSSTCGLDYRVVSLFNVRDDIVRWEHQGSWHVMVVEVWFLATTMRRNISSLLRRTILSGCCASDERLHSAEARQRKSEPTSLPRNA